MALQYVMALVAILQKFIVHQYYGTMTMVFVVMDEDSGAARRREAFRGMTRIFFYFFDF